MSVTVGSLISKVQEEIDPRKRRFDDARVLAYLNEAVTLLGNEKCFKRRDIIAGVANQSYYACHVEPRQIDKVWFNRVRLDPSDLGALDSLLGAKWQDTATATPAYYVPMRKGVRLAQTPSASGTALTFSGTPSVDSNAGKSVNGDRLWSALDSSTLKHFNPGDGVCTNAESAGNNLWVDYWYRPQSITQNMSISSGLEIALQNFALYRCLRSSRDAAMMQRRQDAYATWEEQKRDLIAQASDPALSAESHYRADISSAF